MTVIAVLAVVALGVLLIHLLNSQHDERIAAFRYGTGTRRDLNDGERGRVRRRSRTRNGVAGAEPGADSARAAARRR